MGINWKQEWSFDWVYTITPGIKLTDTMTGVYDNAIFTPALSGGQYYIEIPNGFPGAGEIQFILAVYEESEILLWNNIWSSLINPNAVNYYSDYYNTENSTIVFLNSAPSGNVQVIGIYYSGETLGRYTGLNSWPVILNWKRNDDDYASVWAPTLLLDTITYFHFAYNYTNDILYRNLIDDNWETFLQYHAPRVPPLIADNYERSFVDVGDNMSVFRNCDGDFDNIFQNFDIINDEDKRVLNFELNFDASPYQAAWYGYYSNIEGMSTFPWNTITKVKLNMKGFNQGDRLFINLNNAKISYSDRYDEKYAYIHSIPDYFTEYIDYDITLENFWTLENIYDCRDRLKAFWYSYTDLGSITTEDGHEIFEVSDEVFYTYMKGSWNGTYAYLGMGISNTSENTDYRTKDNLNFILKFEESYVGDLLVTVKQSLGGVDDVDRNYTINISDGTDYERYTINFDDFSPAIDVSTDGKIIKWIQFQPLTVPTANAMRFADIKFGNHNDYNTNKENLLLFQFYCDNNIAPGLKPKFYINSISFDLNIVDDYPYTVPLALTIRPWGIDYWRGPVITHYVDPCAAKIKEDSIIENTFITYVEDAMNYYNDISGGIKGITMPIHTKNLLENVFSIGSEYFNKFSWQNTYRDYGKTKGMYLFNELLIDSSGNSNTLSLSGSTYSYTTGICQPDNTTISLSNNTFLYSYANFFTDLGSFSFEVLFSTLSPSATIIEKINSDVGFICRLNNGIPEVYISDGADNITLSSDEIVNDDNFYLITLVYDITDGSKLYVNGVLKESNINIFNSLDNISPLRIGDGNSIKYDFVKISDRSLVNAEIPANWNYLNCTGSPSYYPELSYANSQYWLWFKIATHYYLTGDERTKTLCDNWINWFKSFIINTEGYYNAPSWFFETGFGYSENYSPGIIEPIITGMLFYYWRNGDSEVAILIRNLLDDMKNNSWDSELGYRDWYGPVLKTCGWINGKLFRLWGLVVNGRPPGVINEAEEYYKFEKTQDDVYHYIDFYNWIMNNKSDSKPAVINSHNIPFVFREAGRSWELAPHYLAEEQQGSTETLFNFSAGALEWGRFSGDYSWFKLLIGLIYDIEIENRRVPYRNKKRT